MMNLGIVLASWRLIERIGQRELAWRIGIPVDALIHLEAEGMCSADHLGAVVRWLFADDLTCRRPWDTCHEEGR